MSRKKIGAYYSQSPNYLLPKHDKKLVIKKDQQSKRVL